MKSASIRSTAATTSRSPSSPRGPCRAGALPAQIPLPRPPHPSTPRGSPRHNGIVRYIVLSIRSGYPPSIWSAPDAGAIRSHYGVHGRTLAELARRIGMLDSAEVYILNLANARRYAQRSTPTAAAVARELASLRPVR